MRVHFTSPWNWRIPNAGLSHIAFQPGDAIVTKAQGEEAIAAGVAKEIKRDDAAKQSRD